MKITLSLQEILSAIADWINNNTEYTITSEDVSINNPNLHSSSELTAEINIEVK